MREDLQKHLEVLDKSNYEESFKNYTYDNLFESKLLGYTIYESLRYSPPVSTTFQISAIGGKQKIAGVDLFPEDRIIVNIYHLHRDPREW